MKITKNGIIQLTEEEVVTLCRAEYILDRVLTICEEADVLNDEIIETFDEVPYLKKNIENAWQALYKLNTETEEKNGTTRN